MTDRSESWTRTELLELLSHDSQATRLARLRRIGVIDEHNRVTDHAKNWGGVLSRTAVEGDEPDGAPDTGE
ncbi:MAG: hypothetical protein IAG13_31800 [Deltaproteobacteria bacterium]|nr:hypothetical protein [Nannocystaceae bacterium]